MTFMMPLMEKDLPVADAVNVEWQVTGDGCVQK